MPSGAALIAFGCSLPRHRRRLKVRLRASIFSSLGLQQQQHCWWSLQLIAAAVSSGSSSSIRTELEGCTVEFWASGERQDILIPHEACDAAQEIGLDASAYVAGDGPDWAENLRCGSVYDSVLALCGRLVQELGASAAAGRAPAGAVKVLELGAGMGLPGLRAALSGASVVLSDYHPGVLRLLERNVRANGLEGSVEVRRLAWGEEGAEEPWLRGGFDLVLAADTVYYPEGVEPQLRTARAALGPSGALLLAFKHREIVDPALLFDAAARAGFALRGEEQAAGICKGDIRVLVFVPQQIALGREDP